MCSFADYEEYEAANNVVVAKKGTEPDYDIIRSFDVMLEFAGDITEFRRGDYPVSICFYAETKSHTKEISIIPVREGMENGLCEFITDLSIAFTTSILAHSERKARCVSKNVTKVFLKGTPDEKLALNEVSFDIKDGEFVTVIGGNGSGKSTTLNILAGTIKPDSGSVLLNNVDITDGEFVPAASKRYNIALWYDGAAVNGIVRGAAWRIFKNAEWRWWERRMAIYLSPSQQGTFGTRV